MTLWPGLKKKIRLSMERKFYDIHYHLFDLSHPNLLAFMLRDDLLTRNSFRKAIDGFPFILKMLPLWMLKCFSGQAVRKIRNFIEHDTRNFRNLLSVMEGAIEYHFLYTEYFLKREKKYFGNFPGARYNKLVICPLLMDFGYKNMNIQDCFYNLPPAKPIVNQVVDLLNAIRFYYNYELIPHPDKLGRLKIVPSSCKKEEKLFEIYPFLGLNTKNYDLSEIVDLFDKYFRDYGSDLNPSDRQSKLFSKAGTLNAGLEDMFLRREEKKDGNIYNYIFAGIKLYPPIDFDPWPENDSVELDKVRFLYSECCRKRIPLTVHCSDGGFATTPDAVKFTDPSNRWKKVLARTEYKDLRINFAHIGSQKRGNSNWQQTILNTILQNRNVFSDISCQTPGKEDYEKINRLMNPETEGNILFGSDFVINLIWSASYNEYLYNFIETGYLDEHKKKLMCEVNPEKFLFG